MELHFYPGEHLLVVYDDKGKLVGTYEAWGGPPKKGSDPRMAEEPTWPGAYLIGQAHPYSTPTWPMSKIKWSTLLKDMPAKNDVWYALPSGKWGSVSKDVGASRTELIEHHFKLYNERIIPKTWVFNDFGPIAIRWFKDLNGNGRLDGRESLSGQMFHTTPDNEAQQARGLPLALVSSHGCIHIKPPDRDELFKIKAFKEGTPFIVHKYHETYRKP